MSAHERGRRGWSRDLGLGFRLTVHDRSSFLRICFTAVGVALSLGILLAVASVPGAVQARHDRAQALSPVTAKKSDGAPSTVAILPYSSDSYYGRSIDLTVVFDATDRSTTPVGLVRMPKPGELFVSPALKALLDSPEGELLRPRYPERLTGVIGTDGLTGPGELRAYRGLADPGDAPLTWVTGWNAPSPPPGALAAILTALATAVAAIVLIPPLTFVSMAGRLSSASRDRRLAAMRLAGVSANQARRVAAGETLPASLLGLVLGAALFLGGRQLLPRLEFGAESLFAGDLTPSVPLALIAVLGLPLLAIAVAVFGLRRVVVEPLGVSRRGGSHRRHLLWRFIPLVLGAGGLAFLLAHKDLATSGRGAVLLIGSTTLSLIAVPLLMPAIVDAVVRRIPTGRTASWTLAVRRLQADPESSSRIVSGIAVTLAGVIVLQGILSFVGSIRNDADAGTADQTSAYLPGTPRSLSLVGQLDTIPGVTAVTAAVPMTLAPSGSDASDPDGQFYAAYAKCAVVERELDVSCAEGQAYAVAGQSADQVPAAGTELQLVRYPADNPEGPPMLAKPVLTMPEVTTARPRSNSSVGGAQLIFTPGSFPLTEAEILQATDGFTFKVYSTRDSADVAELVRNLIFRDPVVAATTFVYGQGESSSPQSSYNRTLQTMQTLLLVVGSSIVLLAMGALVVSSADQIAERRATFANLAASGFPRSVLARSVLYAAALPTLISVVLASAAGAALTYVFISLTGVDSPNVAPGPVIGLSAAAIVLVLLAVAATLPAVRSATRPERLRLE